MSAKVVGFPRITVVTVSFNQSQFLAEAMESVLDQEYENLEYIVVDPGSTDGSREIIARLAGRCSRIVLDQDLGPADGLNNGFRHATGELYGFLNSDDLLLPGALNAIAEAARRTQADVLSGHSLVIDASDNVIRKSYSDRYDLRAVAYGACVLMQPSTFFKASVFKNTGGFNVENTSNWDGELFVEMALRGAKFAVLPWFLSGYRLYPGTITSTPASRNLIRQYQLRMFKRIMGRPPQASDVLGRSYYRARKYAHCPAAFSERVLRGPIFGRFPS